MYWTEFEGVYPHDYILPPKAEPQRGPRGQLVPSQWGRRHGRHAVTHWQHGKMIGADEIRLPTGKKRGRARWVVRSQNTWLRPLNDERRAFDRDFLRVPIRWQRGHLEITDRDVVFIDDSPSPYPDFSLDRHAPLLKKDLFENAEVHRIASELEGAIALRNLLQSKFVRAADSLDQQLMSGDDCADFVVLVRGLNETIQDLKYADPTVIDTDRVDALAAVLLNLMAEIGWVLEPLDPKLLSELEGLRVRAEKAAAGSNPELAKKASDWLIRLDWMLGHWPSTKRD